MERRELIVGVCRAASEGSSELSSREHFRELLKRSFRVYDDRSRFLDELQLVSIEDGPSAKGLEQFDLIFEGVFGEGLTEGSYVLQETRSRRSYAMQLQERETTKTYRATFSLLV